MDRNSEVVNGNRSHDFRAAGASALNQFLCWRWFWAGRTLRNIWNEIGLFP